MMRAGSGHEWFGGPGALAFAVALVSAVGLGYEIALTRILAVGQWHHFAHMVVSVAMLGFGAAGTWLAVVRARLEGRERRAFRICLLALTLVLPWSYAVSQRIPFETFELTTQPVQWLYLPLLYFTLALPFFFVSACISLALAARADRVGFIYAASMTGSGLGALGTVLLLYLAPPARLPACLTLPLLILTVMIWPGGIARRLALGLLAGALCAIPAATPIRVSPYKGLSYTLLYPDARIVARRHSPLAEVTAVTSKQIRETPGQISGYPMRELGELPPQVGLFFDGSGPSVINESDGNPGGFAFLDYVTPALPYRLLERPSVLVVGFGGGTDILMALSHGAREVTALDLDPSVFALLRGPFQRFSGGLIDRPDVKAVIADGRAYVASSDKRYDLIQISLLDTFHAAAAGIHALGENNLYTVEAVALFLRHLTEDGILAVTRWVQSPPRDAIKMFATFVEACEAEGLGDAGKHLALIRSWNTATVLAARRPLDPARCDAIRTFCRERSFDVCYYPGMREREANRFTILEEPYYYRAALELLSPRREQFYDDYLFHVRPATDNRPYFFHFFKWAALPRLVSGMGADWIPFVEWGYVALVATLVQAALVSALLVLAPLPWLRRGGRLAAGRWPVAYFALLGLAYMLLEIAFIHKFTLFLAYPVYAVAVMLTTFLLFSGWGSFAGDRSPLSRTRLVALAVLAVVAFALCEVIFLPAVFAAGAAWPVPVRIAASMLLVGPLAFAMGVPFPAGLQWAADRDPRYLPWAWCVNGCASVLGAALALLLAIHFGFRLVVLLAVACYVAAWCALRLSGNAASRQTKC